MAPLRTWLAISAIRGVPSLSFIICEKKNQAIAKAITDATGTSQNTEGIIMNDFCFMLVKDGPPKEMAGPSVKVVRSGMLTQHLQSCSCCE